jgi:hypothetical protein
MRLTAHVEVAGLIRRVEQGGGHAAVLHKGDAERGAILLVIASRGDPVACLERLLDVGGAYRWAASGHESPAQIAEFVEKRQRFDSDTWLIELDVADPERFIATLGTEG